MIVATKKLLLDVQEAGESILLHTGSRTFDDYTGDRFFRRAVEREFEIIGQALNRLTQEDSFTATRLSELQRHIDFCNRISRGYDTVDDRVVWGIVETHLPVLVKEVRTLLSQT